LAHRDERLRQSVEERLHPGGLRTVPDDAGGRTCTSDEPQRRDQEAPSGTRLAGDDVETRAESQPEAIDQGQVRDRELEEASDAHRQPVTRAAARLCAAAGPRTAGRPGARWAGQAVRTPATH